MNAPGPILVRGYICPTIPNGERLQCQSCGRFAIVGHEVIHSEGCAWLAENNGQEAEEPLGAAVKGKNNETA